MAWKASDRREAGEPVKRVVRGSKEEQRQQREAQAAAGGGEEERRRTDKEKNGQEVHKQIAGVGQDRVMGLQPRDCLLN